MKLPPVTPLEENILCNGREEFGKLVARTIEQGDGAFLKVFGKTDGKPYYVTVLMDDEKILAVEAEDVSTGSSMVGKPALEILKELLDSGPVIADAFPMGDVEIKMSIVENIEVYNSTPQMKLEEIYPTLSKTTPEAALPKKPAVGPVSSPRGEPKVVVREVTEEKPEKPKKPRMEVSIKAPAEVDPYFRGMIRRLKNVLKGFGVELKAVEVDAKEVRYALGAGTGIHATVRLAPKGDLPGKVKSELESFIYKEAGEISKEIGKRVVISQVRFS